MIHLKYIRKIAGIFWEGFLLLATLIDPLVCFHPSTGSPQHQWRDPHPGPSKASLQRRWQIIPSVASGVLSRKKCWSQNEEFSPDVFVQFVSPKPYFSEFCHEDVLRTNWRILNISLQFRFETLSYVNPFVQKPLKCMGHVCFKFLDDEFGGRLFFVVVPRWKGWVKPQVVWSYKGDSVPCFNSNHYDPSLMECSLCPWLVIKVGSISNGSQFFNPLRFISMLHNSGK